MCIQSLRDRNFQDDWPCTIKLPLEISPPRLMPAFTIDSKGQVSIKKNFQHLDIEASSPEKGLNSIGRLALAHQACASGLMDRSFISIDA